jgi:AI-2 transport protein TqsA
MSATEGLLRTRLGFVLLVTAASAGLAFFLRSTAEVFVPFIVAVVIALASHPVVEWLGRKKIPTAVSVGVVVIVSMLVLAVAGLLVQRGIDGFLHNLPQFKTRVNELLSTVSRRLGVSAQSVESMGSDPAAMKTIAGLGGSTALSLVNLILQVLLVILYLVFLLLGRRYLPGLAQRAWGRDRARTVLSSIGKIEREMLRYLFLRTVVSLITAAVVGIILHLYGVQFAGLWALLTFFAQYIPFVGPIAMSVVPILMAAVQFPSLSVAAWIALWLSLWHLIVGFIVEPRVFSLGLSLNQTLLLLGLALMGWMWGIVGALIWVPLMVVLRLAAQQIPGWEPVDVLLGPARAFKGHAT